MKVGYFTAGTIGAGHLVRGLAIERGLARAGFRGTYRMFGPSVPFPSVARANHKDVAMTTAELSDPNGAPSSELAQTLRSYAPDLLLVDLFWAPLFHILPLLHCESWLLLRRCPPIWLQGPPHLPFTRQQFAQVIAIEPLDASTHPVDETIAPIVICNPDEQRPRSALRERLAVNEGERLVVIAHAGNPGESLTINAPTTENSAVRRLDLHAAGALFPLAEWLAGADEIHCGAGYNTFWESRWLGYFDRVRFTAFPRSIDSQGWRLATCAALSFRDNGADVIARRITQLSEGKR